MDLRPFRIRLKVTIFSLCETRENFKTCLKFAKRNKVYTQLLSNCQLRPRILNLGSSIGDNLFFAWHSMITKGDVNS